MTEPSQRRRIFAIVAVAVLALILAAALWSFAVGNRRIVSATVAVAAAAAAWRVWAYLRGDHQDDGYRMPRWVKVAGLVSLGLVLLLVGAVALGVGGEHGPGRHGPGQFGPGSHGSPTDESGAHDEGGSDHGENSPVAEGAREIAVSAENLAFDPAEIVVRVGTDVAIVLTSVDAQHDFTIDELGAHVSADAGETAKGGFHAGPPGHYTFYCSVPGHREAGMEGTLVVTGGH